MKSNNLNPKNNQEEIVFKKHKIRNFMQKIYNRIFKNMSSVKQILLWYLLISITGALLLYMPFSQNIVFDETNQQIYPSFIDCLFISSSAFSDTGLATIDIDKYFNWFGQLMTLLLLDIGGIGWFTIKIFIITFILRKTTKYHDITEGSAEIGGNTKSQTLGLIFSAVVITLIATIIGGIIFSIMFATISPIPVDPSNTIDPGLKNNWGLSIWTGIYHASASINNAGLDIFKGDSSLSSYYGNIGIQIVTMSLFILGGIGFGVFYDIYLYLKNKKSGKIFTFSLVTKLSVIVYLFVSLIGLLLVFSFEGIASINHPDSFLGINNKDTYGSIGLRMWALTFNTFSTRNAGFSTVDFNNFTTSTLLTQSLMMFIGSGPGSTAGGLRTTTTAVIIVSLFSFIKSRQNVSIFDRTISQKQVRDSFVILLFSLALVMLSTMLILSAESMNHNWKVFPDNRPDFMAVWFVLMSAYGTTGLVTLSTEGFGQITIFSKIIIILIMFIGQMGISTTLRQFKKTSINVQRSYVEENVTFG